MNVKIGLQNCGPALPAEAEKQVEQVNIRKLQIRLSKYLPDEILNIEDLIEKVFEFIRINKLDRKAFAQRLGFTWKKFRKLIWYKDGTTWSNFTPDTKDSYLRIKLFFDDSNRLEKYQQNTFLTEIIRQYPTKIGKNFQNVANNDCKHDGMIYYDMSGLNKQTCLNIKSIVSKIKYELQKNSISKRLFARVVLNTKESYLQYLLEEPYVWNDQLNSNLKEKFYRMYLWLNDNDRVKKLADWKKHYQTRMKIVNNIDKLIEIEPIKYDISKIVIKNGFLKPADICKTCLEIMKENKITQKMVCLALIKLIPAKASAFFSEKKSWIELSKPYKDRYLTIYKWLNDNDGVNKIKNWIEKYKELRTTALEKQGVNETKMQQSIKLYQLEMLRKEYKINPMPSGAKLNEIAEAAKMSFNDVRIWFRKKRNDNKITEINFSSNEEAFCSKNIQETENVAQKESFEFKCEYNSENDYTYSNNSDDDFDSNIAMNSEKNNESGIKTSSFCNQSDASEDEFINIKIEYQSDDEEASPQVYARVGI